MKKKKGGKKKKSQYALQTRYNLGLFQSMYNTTSDLGSARVDNMLQNTL